MKKIIFGSACMVSGLLLVLIMLFVDAYSHVLGGLNFLGNLLIWGGVAATIIGVILCLLNLRDDGE